jgi:hypothetical protein
MPRSRTKEQIESKSEHFFVPIHQDRHLEAVFSRFMHAHLFFV